MINTAKFWIILLLFNTLIIKSFAQSEGIESDRPGQTLIPFTTAKKWIQTEIGLSFESFQLSGTDKQHFIEHPQALIKYGLFKNFELRTLSALGTRYGKSYGPNYSFTGLSDLQVGFKFKFINQKNILPHTSLIVHYMINSLNGVRAPRRDTSDGLHARLAMQHSISDVFTLNYNVGIEWPSFARNHRYLYSLSPRFYFLEKWMVYAEVFGNVWDYRSPQHNFGGGLSYLIKENIKLDANYSKWRPMFDRSNYFSIGASLRFRTNDEN